MILTVHDELVLEVSESEKEVVSEIVRRNMEQAFPLEAPLEVEVGIGPTWGQAH